MRRDDEGLDPWPGSREKPVFRAEAQAVQSREERGQVP